MTKRAWLIACAVLALLLAGLPAGAAEEARAVSTTAKIATDDAADIDQKRFFAPEVTESERYVVEFSGRADLAPAFDIADFRERGEFVVRELRATADRAQREARRQLADRGVEAASFWFRNVMVVDADEATAEELAALPGVVEVRPERIYPLVRPVAQGAPIEVNAGDPEWGIERIGADQVWDEGILGGGVVVANVDTGVDYTHEALVNQYRGNLGGGAFSHDYNWWDPSGICGDEPCDNIDHGTHTMGTMVGGDGPGPFAPDIGVAPGAQWIAAKGCEDFGCSEFALLSSGQFLLAPTDLNGENPDPDKRPDIVNNSWGGGPGDEFYLDTVLNWRAAGIIPVFSSGNPGPFCGEGGSPGDFNETFSVGATDIDDIIADFSGRGPSVFGKINPNVSAPGVDVTSAVPGDGYASFSGTSMAAPHVAGTLALVLSSTPELFGDFDGATSPVAQTAVDIIDMSCGGDEDGDPNNVYGEGRIDAAAAVLLVATGGTLDGTVIAAEGGAPIAGARIEATSEGRTYSVTTDDDGSYSMFLPAGEYGVTASAFAYETAVASGVVIVTDETTTQDFALIALPSATVSGRVVRAESGRPVYGAEVAALGVPVAPVVTDRNGAYSFTLPIGVYTLEASYGRCMTTDTTEVELFDDLTGVDLALAQRIDDFGYGCQTIPFRWIDADLPGFVYGDDQTGRMRMPFPFPFYGNDFDELYVASNGYVAFQDEFLGFSAYWNEPIPSRAEPNAAVYALWDDLWVVGDSYVEWGTIERRDQSGVVIEYSKVAELGREAGGDFEIILWDDGTIDMLYGEGMENLGSGDGATIGIESPNGRDGLMYSFNEPVVPSGTAIRFLEVPTGVVTGTVTNANDGLPVAGVTVTADPTGRSATTDADGVYSLKLVPGSYTLTYEASGYDTQTRTARVRVGQVLTIDVALPAPTAVVSPSSIEATAPIGETITETVTVTNAGTGVLTWEALEREEGVTPPDLPPATERVTWLTGEMPVSVPEGFQPDLRAWPTFDGPLQPVIEDPAGDAGSPTDVILVSGGADDAELSMKIDFTDDTPMDQATGYVFLDTDQDPATGLPPEALYGSPAQDIGAEYFVDMYEASFGFAWVVDANEFFIVAEIPVVTEGSSYRFDIPLEVLGDDGFVDVALAMSDFEFFGFDWVPDAGHGTIQPFRDAPWMSADPASGSVGPGESTDVTVTLGGEGFVPGEYSATLVFVTNDPRQSTHEVDVALNITLPEDFGGLEGTITNARAGFPLPALVTVDAERDGAPYPVEAQALDTDGTYLLFAPAGTWPITVEWEGYATFTGEVTITAGATATLDVAVDPLWPWATLEGGPVEVTLAAGDTATAELVLGNVDGLAPLEFEVFELEGGAAPAVEAIRNTNASPQAVEGDSATAPESYEAASPPAHTNNGGSVALFLDALPWESEALFIVLDAYGIPFDVYPSESMGEFDLSGYKAVMIANDQPQFFNDAYVENFGWFEDYVFGGGFLWFGAAAWGWNGGDLSDAPLPGGATVGSELYEELNSVAAPDHPVMAGVEDPFFGSLASHTWFDNTPEGSVLAFAFDAGLPTLLDYSFGAGRVLALAQPVEFNWEVGEDGGLILENGVAYMDSFQPFTDLPWLSVDPAAGTVGEGESMVLEVTVDAADLEPGEYTAQLVVLTNDPVNATVRSDVIVTVTE